MWQRISTRAKRWLVVVSVASIVSIGMTWPILYDGHSTPLSLLAMGTTMLWLVSVFDMGYSNGGWLWAASAVALVLGVVAPFVAALALSPDGASVPTWWIGLSVLFGVATAMVAIAQHRELARAARGGLGGSGSGF